MFHYYSREMVSAILLLESAVILIDSDESPLKKDLSDKFSHDSKLVTN